jgi:hypothetical protein
MSQQVGARFSTPFIPKSDQRAAKVRHISLNTGREMIE